MRLAGPDTELKRRLHFYENGPNVNREMNLASIRTRLAPVAPGAICVPVHCGAAI